MKLSLILLGAFLGLSLADDYWGSFGDWDDDNLFGGYRPTGLLQGGRLGFSSRPRYNSFNRGRRVINSGNLGQSAGRLFSGYAGYGSYGRNYGSGSLSGGTLGMSSNRMKPYRRYRYNSRRSIIRPSSGIGSRAIGLAFSDDDFDDFDDINVGILGPSVVQRGNRGQSIRPTINNFYRQRSAIRPVVNRRPSPIRIQKSIDNDEDDITRGILGPAVIRNGGNRASIQPIDHKTYDRKLSSLQSNTGIGGSAVSITRPFKSDENDLDDRRGILGPAVVRPSGSSVSIRPAIKPHNRIHHTGVTSGNLGGSIIGLKDDDEDDFNRGFLGTSVGGVRGGRIRHNNGHHKGIQIQSNVGGSAVQLQPSFKNDDNDFDRGILGPAVGAGHDSGREPKSHSLHYNTHQSHYRKTTGHNLGLPHGNDDFYDDDNFGSAPVFSSNSIHGGVAGYGTHYPNHGHGNTYANIYNFGGSGGGWLGGSRSGFGGRLTGRFGGGSFGQGQHGGGGGSGSGGGESDDYDYDSNESGGSSGGFGSAGFGGAGFGGFGGFGGSGILGGAAGVAGRFVGGGFGSIGGIRGSQGGLGYGAYTQNYKKLSY